MFFSSLGGGSLAGGGAMILDMLVNASISNVSGI